MLKIIFLAVLVIAMSNASFALAQSDYPNRQIEFIVPFAPGGPADTAAPDRSAATFRQSRSADCPYQ
jgi:tripartite-type tricarboxylate transporter receptor subunit TctC